MKEYLLYYGILLIGIFLIDRLIVSRVILREVKRWIFLFAGLLCILGSSFFIEFWACLSSLTLGAIFLMLFFVIRNNEYLRQEMARMNWVNMGFYDGEYRKFVSQDIRYRAFAHVLEDRMNDYYKEVFLEGRPSMERLTGECLMMRQNADTDQQKDPLTESFESYENLINVITAVRIDALEEQISAGWYQRRFLHLYKKVVKEDFVRTDSAPEIYDLCKKSRRLLCLPSVRWKAEDRLREILNEDLTLYGKSLVADYITRYNKKIRDYAEKFSDEYVAGAAAAYYAQLKMRLENGEDLLCLICEDEISIGDESRNLADFGFDMSYNHFRQAGLVYRILLNMNRLYREDHGSMEWPYYIVPTFHVEKEEYRYIVLKCTVEPDGFHALSGPEG